LKYGIEDAGIKKAGVFYIIFSQKMGINILRGPLRKSSLGISPSNPHPKPNPNVNKPISGISPYPPVDNI